MRATHNYWGTVNEDELVSWLGGGAVNYSPWTDASHTALYNTDYVSGLVSGVTTWQDSVTVVGDVVVPQGSRLTIAAGTRVQENSMYNAPCRYFPT